MQAEINDEVFGLLKQYSSMSENYRSTIYMASTGPVKILLDVQYVKDEDFPAILKAAHKTYFALQEMTDSLLQAVVDEFLPTPEHGWKADLISKEEFLSHLRLTGIDFGSDGSANVYYSPNDELGWIFGDHIVNVCVDPDLQIYYVNMQ